MKTNLTARTVVIVVTILVCVYGIINVPKSKAELLQNLQNNIRLGLDLKGGSHIVLEVQVQDAVKADAEQTAVFILEAYALAESRIEDTRAIGKYGRDAADSILDSFKRAGGQLKESID